MKDSYLAHSANKANNVDLLKSHLKNVAELASRYAGVFDAADEAYLTGLLHDVGKYGDLFQRRLQGKEHGIDHWSIGAWLALMRLKKQGVAPALVIQGHHIGLQQASKDYLRTLNPQTLQNAHPENLRLSEVNLNSLMKRFSDDGFNLDNYSLTKSLYEGNVTHRNASAMLQIRMLYSALVDADFIDTEAHFNELPETGKVYRPQGLPLNPDKGLETLAGYLETLRKTSQSAPEVNRMRDDLMQSCLDAAARAPGLYTLSAPTGTGKTLGMLAFALKHAATHNLRRIVVVIPYLTIIEQTANQYKSLYSNVFESAQIDRFVLEHHTMSGLHQSEQTSQGEPMDMEDEKSYAVKCLVDNWDAPIILTTSVQFLESLFANRPGPCRKLHRLAKSVILFDEVQTLPQKIAIPTLATLASLTERFGSTVAFATATQPAFRHLDDEVKKFCATGWSPREIVPEDLDLFKRAKRTETIWPTSPTSVTSWSDLARQIAESKSQQTLTIVNLKKHAIGLFEELKKLGTSNLFHLSTNMCPAHRDKTLEQVRTYLAAGAPCHLISTQCVEAGVDIDFPVVYRALGPLESIAQAAGRCNRNGTISYGNVHIFIPEDENFPDGTYKQAASITRVLLKKYSSRLDIDDPALFEEYYKQLYSVSDVANANKELIEAINLQHFPNVAKEYRVIEQDAVNVLVPYDPEHFQELKNEVYLSGLTKKWIAKARPYAVSVFRPRSNDPITPYMDPVPVAGTKSDEWFIYLEKDHYKEDTGLNPPKDTNCFIS